MNSMSGEKVSKKRYSMLDYIRGITLLSMILYHAMWDVVYILGKRVAWYQSDIGYLWQQSICWAFILLSGFCWSLGGQKWKRGIMVSMAGALITCVTVIVMPENQVVFGVLTLLGTCMLLLIPLDKHLRRIDPKLGFLVSAILFTLTRNINMGYLGFEGWKVMKLPAGLYRNLVTAFLGMPGDTFVSTDYFSLFPWFFLFTAGYFIYGLMEQKDWLQWLAWKEIPGFAWIGKHSLEIYLLHQPILYAGLMVYAC
ncbi:MAG: heparan-alpha-glucosaminide N-acetyltransferase domain-containing protein [Lachnospiraceae bacterium]|nr:heparan-alpha-glucosaminide N-acetyltransferase domain-containing protein [Lachnospiraceae bacterium]